MRLAPGATIGILGGGQLGRMTALAAARLGYRCHVFAPEPDGPAAAGDRLATIAPYDDAAALARFAAAVDVVTIEFENVPVDALSRAGARAGRCARRPRCSRSARTGAQEKTFLERHRRADAPGTAVVRDARDAGAGAGRARRARRC